METLKLQDFDILYYMAFRERLREEIEYKGMLVKEISAAVGISNSTFLSYIDSRGVLPNVETAVKIAKVLGVSVEYLVDGENEKKDELSVKNQNISEITKDLASLDDEKLCIIKKMVHSLVV